MVFRGSCWDFLEPRFIEFFFFFFFFSDFDGVQNTLAPCSHF